MKSSTKCATVVIIAVIAACPAGNAANAAEVPKQEKSEGFFSLPVENTRYCGNELFRAFENYHEAIWRRLRESEFSGGDLAIVRQETRRAGIPFWIFVQAEGIRSHLRVPNRPEVFWQANTASAYGARGIFWFCYWTPQPDQDFPRIEGAPPPLIEAHHDAMINSEGQRTPLWDHVREQNLFLRKAGRALIGWDNKFLAHYADGSLQSGTGPAARIEVGQDVSIPPLCRPNLGTRLG